MNITDLSTILAKYSFVIAIVVIILFLFYQFYLKPKYINKKETVIQSEPNKNDLANYIPVIQRDVEEQKKDNPLQRISRGFKTINEKIANSDYVKGIQEEQENAKFDDYLPNNFKQEDEEPKKNKKQKPLPDPFSTDFSNLGATDI